ncbi:MATE family efflux transporter [Breznakiella homolactica]|uniref:Multidrug export protein MepA n=1 Tax=Breznakiella homolactica TaxID=2798577 RepID=A0A7T8BBH3_9SPIR|nr:MATE family efflux transporter [Breznakiella homolactica]QQO09228.1 MATE family efflux transporter [Breznakiella homolactica]
MNALSQNFSFPSLLRFALPTIIMMVFMSLYTMVDGVFVSRLIGTKALSAVNIVYPLINFVVAVGIMLASGGSAIIAKQMGEGRAREANENFSFITVVGILMGAVLSILGFIFIEPLLRLLGANDAIYGYCYDYTRMLLFFIVPSIMQMLFQFFFVAAGKPNTGLLVTVAGGVANIILDYVFIALAGMGIRGAALATGIGYSIPGLFGLIYFTAKRKGTLYFVKPRFRPAVLLKTCTNGASEMVTNISTAVVTFLFNIIMMNYLGEDGVAAITIVLYAQFLLTSLYMGYSSGVAPVISYNYGKNNHRQLKKLFRISMVFLSVSSVLMYVLALLLENSIITIFTAPGTEVFAIAENGFRLFAFAYLFMGINIFASSLFTALSNGKVSAILSFLRTFVFIVLAIGILPRVIGINGVWLAVPAAEVLAIAVSLFYIHTLRGRYKYA